MSYTQMVTKTAVNILLLIALGKKSFVLEDGRVETIQSTALEPTDSLYEIGNVGQEINVMTLVDLLITIQKETSVFWGVWVERYEDKWYLRLMVADLEQPDDLEY